MSMQLDMDDEEDFLTSSFTVVVFFFNFRRRLLLTGPLGAEGGLAANRKFSSGVISNLQN